MKGSRHLPLQRDLPVFIILVIVSVSIMTLDRIAEPNPIAGVLAKLFVPFERLSSGIMNLSLVYNENKFLRARLVRLSNENMALREQVHGISRLKELVRFKETHPGELCSSRVISEIDGRMGGGIIIDKGHEAGIERNMTVICPDGLVGRIISAGDRISTVKRIVDPGNRVSAMLQKSRATGILKTRSDSKLFMEWVAPDTDVAPGDTVISSGLGSVIPKGILIGQVKSVEHRPDAFSLSLEVGPSANFDRLEEVFVMLAHHPAFQTLLERVDQ